MRLNLLRDPSEQPILAVTVLAIHILLVLMAGLSLCLLPLGIIIFVVIAYFLNKSHHAELIGRATQVTAQSAPNLAKLAAESGLKLNSGPYKLYVLPSNQLNAYTFGFSDPRVVVLYSPLLKVMDETELRFILGHELGHIIFNHTWINTLLGGMSGTPLTLELALVFIFAFRWWNRACEYSSDRAGLLACGSLESATSALVKLVVQGVDSQAEIEQALQVLDAQDDSVWNVLGETLSTHPMVIRRIERMRKFAASPEYRQLVQAAARA